MEKSDAKKKGKTKKKKQKTLLAPLAS